MYIFVYTGIRLHLFDQLFVYIFLLTFSDLLQEMQIMQKIGHHPNVVTLLGVSIDKGNSNFFFQGQNLLLFFNLAAQKYLLT